MAAEAFSLQFSCLSFIFKSFPTTAATKVESSSTFIQMQFQIDSGRVVPEHAHTFNDFCAMMVLKPFFRMD